MQYPNQINLDGYEISESIYCIGLANHYKDDEYTVLANYYGVLALISIKIKSMVSLV